MGNQVGRIMCEPQARSPKVEPGRKTLTAHLGPLQTSSSSPAQSQALSRVTKSTRSRSCTSEC